MSALGTRIHSITPENVVKYRNEYASLRDPDGRYASFDYCFNYFRRFTVEKSHRPDDPEHLQLSTLHLGYYLASWGMLRNSFLRTQSSRALTSTVRAISDVPRSVWNLDVDDYGDNEAVNQILATKEKIIKALKPNVPTETLVTKIMLGVFGNVPAFDQFFRVGTPLNRHNEASIASSHSFYQKIKDEIREGRRPTLDFSSGQPTSYIYTNAKVIDMIFFMRRNRE
ncbi:MAG: hypothetical protein ACKOD2_13580 [Ilumatobacteraceae bacterium]